MKGFGANPGACRVKLQVESGCLYRLLLIAGQTDEAVGEGVGDAEVHQFSLSQAQWLAPPKLKYPNDDTGSSSHQRVIAVLRQRSTCLPSSMPCFASAYEAFAGRTP